MKQFITSQGLGSDQGRDLIFGLNPVAAVETITVEFQDGTTKTVKAPNLASVVTFDAP